MQRFCDMAEIAQAIEVTVTRDGMWMVNPRYMEDVAPESMVAEARKLAKDAHDAINDDNEAAMKHKGICQTLKRLHDVLQEMPTHRRAG